MLAYERGGFVIFNVLWNNENVGFRHFKSAVGERRTYMPLFDKGIYVPSKNAYAVCLTRGYMFPQTKWVETLVVLTRKE